MTVSNWDTGAAGGTPAWITQNMTYLSNGNLSTATDPDGHLTVNCY